jgi:c-di-GMP-binding flagellar brake protein YcgR
VSFGTSAMQPSQADAIDRRSGPRRTCRVRASVTLADGTTLAAVSIDISREGMALLLPCPLPVGTECSIHFSVYVFGAIHRILLSARALNSVFMSHDVRVGFAFVRLGTDSQRLLSEFVGHGTRR